MTYLITFSCYGKRLHGDEHGAIDRNHRQYGNRTIEPNRAWVESARERMTETPFELDESRRKIVLSGILCACERRGWRLAAAHVRSTHVHAVVVAEAAAEVALSGLKAYASRALNESGLDEGRRHYWAHHGSTRYLWDRPHVRSAIQYVLEQQGAPMEVHTDIDERW
jgi:REP element-mobilizing transposase RayT